LPECKPRRNKRVAIVGAGPAGLSAAYYLQQEGYDCTVFDEHEEPGGMLRYAVSEQELPKDVLAKEISLIKKLGVRFQGSTRVGVALSMEKLRSDFDAVFVAVGQLKPGDAESMGLEAGPDGIAVNAKTYEVSLPGVFAGGDAVRKRRGAVRAVADGKEAAVSINQYLSGEIVIRLGRTRPFNTRIGKLREGEIERFMACVSEAHRTTPSQKDGGFTEAQARQEAARCLHCDCRKAESCKLRQYARQYGARPSRYKGESACGGFVQCVQHPDVIYEPGKCIDCGLCIKIAAEAGEELGLTFIGRGFDVRVAVPFDRSMAEALSHAANRCVTACPTGALAFKNRSTVFHP